MTIEHSSSGSENAHLQLLTALRESEMLREIAELLASSLDLEHILQVLVKRTTEVCEVERCTVWLLEESQNQLRPAAYHVSSTSISQERIQAADAIWFRSPLSKDNEVIIRLLEEKGMLYLEDLRKEPAMQNVAHIFLVQSVLLIALIKEGRPVGMMTLDDPDQKRVFSPAQEQLARAIGQQAAVAIDNARLYQQAQAERRRAEQLIERAQAVNQIALAVNSGKDLQGVLEIATQNLVRCLNADGGATVLLEDGILRLTTVTHPLTDETDASQTSIPLDVLPICQQAATQGSLIFQRYQHAETREGHWYQQLGLENFLIVPLMIGNQPEAPEQQYCVGLVFVNYHRTSYRPSRGQYAFAQDIAAQCALAIEKAHLLTKSRQAAELATERANTLDTVFQTMTEAICVFNHDGDIVLRNQTAARFIPHEIINKSQIEAQLHARPIYTIHNELITFQNIPLKRAFRGESVRGERIISKDASGDEVMLEMNASPMLEGSRSLGVVVAFREITEQIRTEQYIRHALETMLQVAEAVSGVTRIDNILQKVLTMALRALHCKRGLVMRYDEQQQLLIPGLSINVDAANQEHWVSAHNEWLRTTVASDQSLQAQLTAGHAMLSSIVASSKPGTDGAERETRLPSLLIAPISYNNHMLGLILLDQSAGEEDLSTSTANQPFFTIWDMAVIEGMTQLTGLAIAQIRWQREATEANAREAAMREANAMKDEFLAITAHEFRTPLTIILAHCQIALRILRRQIETEEQAGRIRESQEIIEEQTHHLTNIVNTFLEVAQINRGQLSLNLEPIDLSEIARQVIARHGSATTNHQITYNIEQAPFPWLVSGDTARLQQILSNLVQNAIKYSPNGGDITITFRRVCGGNNQSFIEVSVKDQGIGIPLDAQPRLFESFYRAPNSKHNKTRGVGLGLYVVAELLRLHGGTIRVESSGQLGEGSCFIFRLPALESETTTHV